MTTKAQTTIPQPVRSALHLKPGDSLAYVIEQDRVVLMKAPTGPVDDPFAAALIAAATGSAQVESFGLRVIVVRTESEARDMPSNWIRCPPRPWSTWISCIGKKPSALQT